MSEPAPIVWPASVTASRRPLDAARAAHPGTPPAAAPAADTEASLLARFTEACEHVGGQVHHAATSDEVVALIEASCEGAPARLVLSWDERHLPLDGLHDALRTRDVGVLTPQVRTDHDGHADDLARLDAAAVGVTGAIALLADTGSVVVTSGEGRPRLASLLPPVHVALVTRAQLVPSLGAWVAANPGVPASVANCVAITGPSRTADIEMTLTRGVHGPRSLHVVFVA